MARTIGEATIEYIHELLKHLLKLLCEGRAPAAGGEGGGREWRATDVGGGHPSAAARGAFR